MTKMVSVQDSMIFLTNVIVLLRKETIELPAFDLNSPEHKGHDKFEWSRRATEMKAVLDDVASKLFVQPKKIYERSSKKRNESQ